MKKTKYYKYVRKASNSIFLPEAESKATKPEDFCKQTADGVVWLWDADDQKWRQAPMGFDGVARHTLHLKHQSISPLERVVAGIPE